MNIKDQLTVCRTSGVDHASPLPTSFTRSTVVARDHLRFVAQCWSPDEAEAIAKACNMHDRLVSALKDLHDACEHWEDQDDSVLLRARELIREDDET